MSEKELGKAEEITVDNFIRTLVGQMFQNDNDTSYLTADLRADDGNTSELEFEIRIVSINGIKTRTEDDTDEDEE